MVAANDGQFRKLCDALRLPELADDARCCCPSASTGLDRSTPVANDNNVKLTVAVRLSEARP